MKRFWSDMELKAHWLLTDDEIVLLKGKTDSGRILFCILLKYYQLYACFPVDLTPIPEDVCEFIAAQIACKFQGFPDMQARKVERMLQRYYHEIRSFLGVRRFDDEGKRSFCQWAIESLFPQAPPAQEMDADIRGWFSRCRYELPSPQVLSRLVGSAEQAFETDLFERIAGDLSSLHRAGLDNLLETSEGFSAFSKLRSEMGSISLASVLDTISRLAVLREIDLPGSLLRGLKPGLMERYRLRAGSEDVRELRRHPETVRLALLSFYCIPRQAETIDGLVDLLLSVVHKISARAERKVVTELVGELTKVNGKTNLLFRIAEAADKDPDGTVRKVIFPVAGEDTIADLVKEYRSDGPAYVKRIYRRIRASYARHYRRMLPYILNTLEFRSNNNAWRPLLDTIGFLKNGASPQRYFSIEDIHVKGVIPSKWWDSVIEEGADGEKRISRINYEICILHGLREKLRTKEIWVVGARRFCNPENDLPHDFDGKREHYYANLGQPLSAETFTDDLKGKMRAALKSLDTSLPKDPDVQLKQKNGKARVSLSPLDPQEDPPNLNALKLELGHRWPATSLLDAFKETDFRTGFTQCFTSTASRTTFEQTDISRKLLLALYGLGTNTGLKAMAAGPNNISYKELLYIRRRYIHRDSLRQATRIVVNATFKARLPEIWVAGTTSCASDSTQFAAWDQNLLTEWHHRYGGRGVMIYWHVDSKAACIHSQLKRCSSSEVAAMIEGVLHHCTEMEVGQHYVDTHGQSVIAFAFCYLLGFDLMPRFKGIDKQKLVRPDKKEVGDYPNIDAIFAQSPINWVLIMQQYDEMIKLATALIERTADAEAILRRFTRGQAQHPVYSALLELGKAAKTLFLCRYLSSKTLRREINTGLNVVERWNGVNNFIYFGKGGEFATNRLEEQEVSVLSLHLLQASLVYINTLMIQEVLAEPAWRTRMSERDMAALSPLPHSHFNPYGDFDLDMSQRLPLETMRMAA